LRKSSVCARDGQRHRNRVTSDSVEFERQRRAMVRTQLLPRGIHDVRVLQAMGRVRREEFVPLPWRDRAYDDGPLPLDGATISQPFIVAYMTELAGVDPGDRVLEAGTGSGYQAAILCEMGAVVFTIELRDWLADEARRRLAALGYDNVHVRVGNAFSGWPEEAPFDAIIVTAAMSSVPAPLIQQLADGGRLVAPVGPPGLQDLVVYVRDGAHLHRHVAGPVAFVPFLDPPAA
jgi:protein-L-isoaspartate(D-aspartate) O-methyltransferase